MAISMYAASTPVFIKALTALSAILDKTASHAADKKIDPTVLLQSRLFPNMFTLTRQIQVSCDFAKGACARLAGVENPKYEDQEQSLADLQARISKTIAFIQTIPAEKINGSEERAISVPAGPERILDFVGQDYLLNFALPNFYFHVTAAYAILRHNGVELSKGDYLGGI